MTCSRFSEAMLRTPAHNEELKPMLDLIFLLLTALFFGAGIVYVRGCERLK
jgi:hypothetical protein